MNLTHLVLFSFFDGASGGGVPPTPPVEEVTTGTGGIDPGEGIKRRRLTRSTFKPTGIADRPVSKSPTVEERLAEAREIAEELREAPVTVGGKEVPPIAVMTAEQIDAEIGGYLRELQVQAMLRQQVEDDETVMIIVGIL